ncbi:MAG: alpha/beta hydrolase, partial [Bacteroidia bacterium]|nr:alpha/beta hydrolase [Bacteroidia bacterium]
SADTSKQYLLLLHGMGVDAKSNWYKQVAYLSKHFNLIMPDLVYFGKSTAKVNDYSVEFQVNQIHDGIRLLGISGKINVMGFSYGGLTAAVFNELYPWDINKLIIVDGPVKYYSAEIADSLAHLYKVKSMSQIIIPQTVEDFNAMKKAVISKRIPFTRGIKKKIVNYYFAPTYSYRSLQINYMVEHQATYQAYTYNFDKTPTLLLWGGRDGVIPAYVGRKIHAEYPETTLLYIYKKAKHDTHFRCSRKLNKRVVKFLEN